MCKSSKETSFEYETQDSKGIRFTLWYICRHTSFSFPTACSVDSLRGISMVNFLHSLCWAPLTVTSLTFFEHFSPPPAASTPCVGLLAAARGPSCSMESIILSNVLSALGLPWPCGFLDVQTLSSLGDLTRDSFLLCREIGPRMLSSNTVDVDLGGSLLFWPCGSQKPTSCEVFNHHLDGVHRLHINLQWISCEEVPRGKTRMLRHMCCS